MAITSKTLNAVEVKENWIIGKVREELARMVVTHVRFGSAHITDMLVGDPTSRIC